MRLGRAQGQSRVPPPTPCLEGTSHADPFLSQLWPPGLAKRFLWFELCSPRSRGPATPGSQCGVIPATEQEMQPRRATGKTGGWRTGQPVTCRLRHTRCGAAGGGPAFSVKSPQAPHSCGLCGKAKLGGSSSRGRDPQGDRPKTARAGRRGAESPAPGHALYVPHTPLQKGKPRVQGGPAWEPCDLWRRDLS